MTKRAILTLNILITILGVILVAVPLFVGTSKMGKAMAEDARIKACGLSVIKSEIGKSLPGSSGIVKNNIDCQRGEYKLLLSDILNDAGTDIDQNKVNRIITKLVYNSWKAVDNGNRNPFTDLVYTGDESNIKFMTLCMVWDRIKFDNPLKDYLQRKNKQVTYEWSYLTKASPVNSDKTYAVLFWGENKVPQLLTYRGNFVIKDGAYNIVKMYVGDLNSRDFFNDILWLRRIGIRGRQTNAFTWSVDIVNTDDDFFKVEPLRTIVGSRYTTTEEYKRCDRIVN